MTLGVIMASLLISITLLEEAVFSSLPLPWRLLPLSFIFSLSLFHRFPFGLGATALMAGSLLSWSTGVVPFSYVLLSLFCLLLAYGLWTRIFASRSLIAFLGLTFCMSFAFILLRFGLLAQVPGFFPTMMIFVGLMTTILSVSASLFIEWCMKLLGRTFVKKNASYEVQTR